MKYVYLKAQIYFFGNMMVTQKESLYKYNRVVDLLKSSKMISDINIIDK